MALSTWVVFQTPLRGDSYLQVSLFSHSSTNMFLTNVAMLSQPRNVTIVYSRLWTWDIALLSVLEHDLLVVLSHPLWSNTWLCSLVVSSVTHLRAFPVSVYLLLLGNLERIKWFLQFWKLKWSILRSGVCWRLVYTIPQQKTDGQANTWEKERIGIKITPAINNLLLWWQH